MRSSNSMPLPCSKIKNLAEVWTFFILLQAVKKNSNLRLCMLYAQSKATL